MMVGWWFVLNYMKHLQLIIIENLVDKNLAETHPKHKLPSNHILVVC